MSSDELRDAIAGALYVRDRFDSPTVVLADAILALPEMQAMLAEVERLRAENATLRRNEWRLIWGLCTKCGKDRDQEARRA